MTPFAPTSFPMNVPLPAPVPPEVQAASILAASFDRIAAALEKLAEAVATERAG